MSVPFLNSIDLNNNEIQNVGFQKLATAPTSPFEGQVYYNSTTKLYGVWDGTAWQYALTPDGVATMTNKTFDANGTGNSITNLEVADFASGVLNISATLASASDTQIPSALATKTFIENSISTAVTGLYDDRGNYDPSSTAYPTTGGSGTAGAILKGDVYTISVAGTIAGVDVQVGNTVRALSDAPGQTATNWNILQRDLEQATTTTIGIVTLATQVEAEAKSNTQKVITPSALVDFTAKKSGLIGDGTATSIVITHNAGTEDVVWQLQRVSDKKIVYTDIFNTTTNTSTVTFAVAPATNSIKAIRIF